MIFLIDFTFSQWLSQQRVRVYCANCENALCHFLSIYGRKIKRNIHQKRIILLVRSPETCSIQFGRYWTQIVLILTVLFLPSFLFLGYVEKRKTDTRSSRAVPVEFYSHSYTGSMLIIITVTSVFVQIAVRSIYCWSLFGRCNTCFNSRMKILIKNVILKSAEPSRGRTATLCRALYFISENKHFADTWPVFFARREPFVRVEWESKVLYE